MSIGCSQIKIAVYDKYLILTCRFSVTLIGFMRLNKANEQQKLILLNYWF
jgi:hypothetical protein